MREQYIRQVKKELDVPRKLKKEVLRDLNEAFDSAAEHGETEEQVAKRLGDPGDFAAGVGENAGPGRSRNRKERRRLAAICCLFVLSAACIAVFLISRAMARPKDVIGQADAMTTIVVRSSSPVSLPAVLLFAGIAAAVAAVCILVSTRARRKR